jgi:uncharacterized protein YlxW (UPF0749 family)
MSIRTPSRPAAGRAVDSSMSLLRDVTELSLDPGYRRAKEAERSGAERAGPAWTALVALLAVLLGCATVWAIRELREPAPLAAKNRQVLLDRIDQSGGSVRRLEGSVVELRGEVETLQRSMVDAPTTGRLDDLVREAAQTPVAGPGLRLTLTDAPSDPDGVADGEDDPAMEGDGRVLDRDLQKVVNAFWAAGAEAIAVNGERLSSLSAIRGAGEAVLVDFKPLIPPYRVEAIGDPATMQAEFAANGGGSWVQLLRDNVGIDVSLAAADRLELAPAGPSTLRWAQPVTPDPAPAGSPGSFTAPGDSADPTGSDSPTLTPEETP